MEQTGATRRTDPAAYACLFGPFHLRAADQSDIVITNRRARALLAMLCLAGDEAIDRDFLSKLLWPGRFEAHAKASLRQCLLDLGKLLAPHGTDILNVSRNSITLHPGSILTDLAALEHALKNGDHAGAIAQLRAIGTKPIFDQMDFGGAFNEWLMRHSNDAERRLGVAVDAAVAALDRSGDRTTAVQLREILAARGTAPPTASPTASVSVPAERTNRTRIAVLPFQSVGEHGAPDYIADGIVEEAITVLGQVPQLLVAGRTSSFHFRNSSLAPSDIAAALRVSHLVEGSVQQQGERLRIHIHLIDGATGFEIWSQRYDGTSSSIFALQERIAQAVTAAIGEALGIAIQKPVVSGPTRDKQAYDLFLQGRSLCSKRFGDGVLSTAVSLFEQALTLDPDFAECWVALAEAHQLIAVYTQCLDRNGTTAIMADCARRAIAIDPGLGYAHALLGLHELTRHNFVGALDYAFQAYRIAPNDPAVAMRLGSFLMFCGRTRDAVPYIQAAVDQDPVDGRKYSLLWGIQFCQGDLDAALVSAQRMVDLGMMSIPLGVTLSVRGQHELGIEKYLLSQQQVNEIILPPVGIGVQSPEAMDAYWQVAARGMCGGREEDRQTYWQVLEMLYAVLHDKSDLAISGPAIFTGNPDLAFRSYGHSITAANLMGFVPLWTRYEPMCRIWQHPGFIAFAERIGMAAAWDKYGWPDLLPAPRNRFEATSPPSN